MTDDTNVSFGPDPSEILEMYEAVTTRPQSPRAQTRRIIEAVCVKHDLPYAEVMGRSRFANVVAARHEAICCVALAFPWMSLPTVGRIFQRDHTTIMHALEKSGVAKRGLRAEGRNVAYRTNMLLLGRLFRQLSRVINVHQSESMEAEVQEPAGENGGRIFREQERACGLAGA